jgi:hypothetical protein
MSRGDVSRHLQLLVVQACVCACAKGLSSSPHHDAAGCLHGWHKLCLRAASCGVPRRGESFYCSEHSDVGGDDVTAMRVD